MKRIAQIVSTTRANAGSHESRHNSAEANAACFEPGAAARHSNARLCIGVYRQLTSLPESKGPLPVKTE
jgi:hypothetical protein